MKYCDLLDCLKYVKQERERMSLSARKVSKALNFSNGTISKLEKDIELNKKSRGAFQKDVVDGRIIRKLKKVFDFYCIDFPEKVDYVDISEHIPAPGDVPWWDPCYICAEEMIESPFNFQKHIENGDFLHKNMGLLPKKQKETLETIYGLNGFNQKNQVEMGEEKGISRQAISSMEKRALKNLKSKMG